MSPQQVNLPTNLRSEPLAGQSMWRTWLTRSLCAVCLCLSIVARSMCQESTSVRIAREADQALRAQNYDLAITHYREVLRTRPSSAAAWSNLGATWYAKGSLSPASDSFIHAARLQPANSDYAFNAALALVRLDKCDVAERYLKESMLSAQHRTAALFLSGLCEFVSDNWQLARETLQRAEASGSRTAETYYMLTIAARKSHSPNEAKRAFELLKSNFPDSSLLHEVVGEALDDDFREAEAQKELSLAIANSPQAPGLHAKLGFLSWKVHQLPEAERLFGQELTIDPHSYSAMHYLGDIAEQNSQLSQALMWYQRALREQPESGEAHFAAGRVLELEGHSDDALKELQACFPALEGDVSAHYWTAKVLRKLGMKEQANSELSRVQEINNTKRNSLVNQLTSGER